MKKSYICLVIVLASFGGCKTPKDSIETNNVENIRWRLTEINGHTLSVDNGEKNAYFKLISNENRVEGFGGCNNFTGTYTLATGNRIYFNKIAATLRMCPDMITEDMFMEVLNKADNYTIEGQVLYLNKARMAPLAKFEAEPLK